MNWHLRPSGYALLWSIVAILYAMFWLWMPELKQHRELVSLALVFALAIIIGVAVHAL